MVKSEICLQHLKKMVGHNFMFDIYVGYSNIYTNKYIINKKFWKCTYDYSEK